jgi:hypothetical protein
VVKSMAGTAVHHNHHLPHQQPPPPFSEVALEEVGRGRRRTHCYENGTDFCTNYNGEHEQGFFIFILELPPPPEPPASTSGRCERRDTLASCRKEPYDLDLDLDEGSREHARLQRLEYLSDYNSQRIEKVNNVEVSFFMEF